jgi:hypothetical protein
MHSASKMRRQCAQILQSDENREYLFFGLKFYSRQGFCGEP